MEVNKKQGSPFSAVAYFFSAIFFLCLGGITTSFYLAITHYLNYTDLGYQSFCAISQSLNCDTVAQSPYSTFLSIPLAVWGFLGYLFYIILTIVLKPRENKWPNLPILFLISLGFSIFSIILAIISSLYINSYCILCIVCYTINFALLLLTWMAQKRFSTEDTFWAYFKTTGLILLKKPSKVLFVSLIFVLILLLTHLYYPKYWLFTPIVKNTNVEYGITAEGNPWIGAKDPKLTIIEYSDYMCFQCGKMHTHLRNLVNTYPEKIRLIHRHFPLDNVVNPIATENTHPNSGYLSMVAILAQEQNLFWQVNDLLFHDARSKLINITRIAEETGLNITNLQEKVNDKKYISRLIKDIRSGIELEIYATPSYVVDGVVYSGGIPTNILSPVLDSN